MTWSDLAAECPTCSERRAFTGDVRVLGGDRYTVHRCPPCEAEFTTWRPRVAGFLDTWLAAPPEVSAAVRRNLEGLQAGDAAVFAGILARPGALPFLRVEDLVLPAGAESGWSRLVLDHDGFVPEPGLAARLEEVCALAMRSSPARAGEPTPIDTLVDRLDTLPIDAVAAALAALPARIGAAGSGKGLRPLIVALRARGGAWAELAERADRRWVIPALRVALEG